MSWMHHPISRQFNPKAHRIRGSYSMSLVQSNLKLVGAVEIPISVVREMSYDILNIMGFAHRPHPHLVDTKSPASQFLLQVYNSMRNEIDVDLSNGENGRRQNWGGKTRQNLTWSEFNVDQDEVDAITKADEIISFVNRGHKYSTLLQGIEEEKQFWFDISEVSSTEQVLGAELRLWKKTLSKEDDILFLELSTTQYVCASISLESAGIITEKESEKHQPFLVSFLKSLDSQKIRKGESKTSRKVNPRRIIRSTKPKRRGRSSV